MPGSAGRDNGDAGPPETADEAEGDREQAGTSQAGALPHHARRQCRRSRLCADHFSHGAHHQEKVIKFEQKKQFKKSQNKTMCTDHFKD